MSVARTRTPSTQKSYRRQALIWLLMALVLGVVTALVWMFSQTPALGAKIENAPIPTPDASVEELKQPLSIESLHELDTDVQPIDFETTIRDLRNYPEEFKDKSYLSKNEGKWTVQVMNVAENDVIVSYLEGRDDREKFAYFRYLDEDKQLRYMLTYAVLNSPQAAAGAAKLVDFGLPDNVQVLPEELNRYVSIIDNYERPGPIKDLSTRRARSVNLQRTKREVPVRQRQQAPSREVNKPVTVDNNQRSVRPTTKTSTATNANTSSESIRKSSDTSATLIINEDRSFETDNANSTTPRRAEPTTAKPPIVAAPKPPSSATSSSNTTTPNTGNKNNSSNNNSNKSSTNSPVAPKGDNDSIKELINEKSN